MWVEVNLEKCTVRQLKEKIEDRIGVSEDNECLHLDLCVWGGGG